MLQAKYMVPRSPTLRTAYRGSKHVRPTLKLRAIWAAGFCLRVMILEENMVSGSSMIQELLAVCLEDIARIPSEKGTPFPDTVILVGDNTVKEVKNTFVMTAVAQLVNHMEVLLADLAGRLCCSLFEFVYESMRHWFYSAVILCLVFYVIDVSQVWGSDDAPCVPHS